MKGSAVVAIGFDRCGVGHDNSPPPQYPRIGEILRTSPVRCYATLGRCLDRFIADSLLSAKLVLDL